MNHSTLDRIAIEIETISQSESQHCNNFATIWHIPEKADLNDDNVEAVEESEFDFGDFILEEGDNSSWTNHHIVTEESDWLAFLEDCVSQWDSDEDDRLEKCRWGIMDVSDFEAEPDTDQPCVIVAEGSYYGYSPTNFVEDDSGSAIVFDSYKEAQNWIDEVYAGTYYLEHNEAGSPDYTIWEK